MSMGVHSLYLLITFAFVSSAMGVKLESNSFCTQEAPVFGEPTKPNLLDESYTTQIAGKIIDEKRMEYFYEYYDADKNVLVYDIRHFHYEEKRIYDYTKTTMQTAFNGVCWKSEDKNKYVKLYSSANMTALDVQLSFGSSSSVWKYKGETTIKGVPVLRWNKCFHRFNTVNTSADFYYTKKDKIPFRLEAKGVDFDKNGKLIKIHQIYDYFLFRKMKPSPNVFKVYFDKKLEVLSERHDLGLATVSDFKRGIQFKMDFLKDTCERKVLYKIAGHDDYTGKNGLLHMETLKHFFLDNGNFTYNGQYKVRGISCDVYTKDGRSAEHDGRSIVEIYIAAKGVQMTNENGKVTSSKRPIVRQVIRGEKLRTVQKQYEIYNFDPDVGPQQTPFNLYPCFDDNK